MENKGQPKQGTGNANERLQQQNPGNSPDSTPQKPTKEGGHAGYSSDEEQKQVNRENDHMHNERDEDELDTSREQKIKTDKKGTPGKEGGNDDYKRNA